MQLSRVGEIVRRHDPDRFFTALFAPAEHRETLFTLYAFNHELARAREAVREPHMALIRLQWWREVVEGARRRHEVAEPLGEALDSGRLLAAELMGMVDAREAEVDGIPDLAAFVDYVGGTGGELMVAAARTLGVADAERLRWAGAACAVSSVLRNTERRGATEHAPLPGDGTTATHLRELGLTWLCQPIRVPRPALAAVLPACFARTHLRGRSGARARVLLAVARGMV